MKLIYKMGLAVLTAALGFQAIANQNYQQDDSAIVIAESDKDKDSKSEKTERVLKDSEITAKVKSKFIEEKLFDKKDVSAFKIHVKTIKGVVYLSGKSTEEQEKNAISIAQSVEGVKEVKSKVKIKEDKKEEENSSN